jgi:hypothetical protein
MIRAAQNCYDTVISRHTDSAYLTPQILLIIVYHYV